MQFKKFLPILASRQMPFLGVTLCACSKCTRVSFTREVDLFAALSGRLTENLARSYLLSKQESAKMNGGGDSAEGSLCEYDRAELTSPLKPNITGYILNPTTCLG